MVLPDSGSMIRLALMIFSLRHLTICKEISGRSHAAHRLQVDLHCLKDFHVKISQTFSNFAFSDLLMKLSVTAYRTKGNWLRVTLWMVSISSRSYFSWFTDVALYCQMSSLIFLLSLWAIPHTPWAMPIHARYLNGIVNTSQWPIKLCQSKIIANLQVLVIPVCQRAPSEHIHKVIVFWYFFRCKMTLVPYNCAIAWFDV